MAAARVRETLDLIYEKQLELMQQVKTVEKGRQDILTACGRIKLQAQQLQQAAAKLQDQGMRAVAQNHKDLAKEAVARRSGILTQLESLSKQMGVLVQQKQRLDATLKVLNSRVSWLQCPAAAGKIELVAGIDDVSEEEPASGPASRTSQSAWWLTPGVFRGLGFAERLTVNETEYHGGWSGHPQPHGKTNILEVDRRGIGLRGFKTIFTIPWDQIVDVDIEGPESAAKKVTAGRVLALGVFALAAKKKVKSAIIIVTLRNGDQAVFESHKALPHEISPKLTPLVAQVRKWASADHQQAVPDAPTNAPQVSLGPSVADELTKLAKLRTEGILTEEEFAAQKAKLLS
jgi:hypothetical protein